MWVLDGAEYTASQPGTAQIGITVAGVACCLHHPEGHERGDRELIRACICRKPSPGMLLDLLARTSCVPASSWMLAGSSLR